MLFVGDVLINVDDGLIVRSALAAITDPVANSLGVAGSVG